MLLWWVCEWGCASAAAAPATATMERMDCSDVLVAEADAAFPAHRCRVRIREPGAFAVFCDQRVSGVLTDTEVPIFIGLDRGNFLSVPDELRQSAWAATFVEFMRLSPQDVLEVLETTPRCAGSDIRWWEVPVHPPVDTERAPAPARSSASGR